MSDQPTKHLWEYDHPYHASPIAARTSYAEGTNHDDHDSWADFLVSWGDCDPDQNLLFRWDWNRDIDNEDGSRNELDLFMVQQRRGDYWSHTITITVTDEPAVREWLTDRARAISTLWEPVLPTTKELEKAQEQTQRLRETVKSFRAPLDWHNADHRARIRQGMVDTLQAMAGRPAEDVADQIMLYSDSAIWAVEREQARTAELAGVVHASAAQLTDTLAHRTDELALARAALGVALHPDAPGRAASGPYAQHVGHHIQVTLADNALSGRLGAATETGLWVGEDDGEYVPAKQIHSVARIENSNVGNATEDAQRRANELNGGV